MGDSKDSGNTMSMNKGGAVFQHRSLFREGFFFFLSGLLTSVPLTLFIGQFGYYFLAGLPAFYATLIPVVLVAPFLEEFAKAFPLFYRHGETPRSLFTFGLLVGLGFGIFEFLTYVLLLDVPIFVRLPGILFHAASTSIIVYGIATGRTVRFYLAAVSLHFLNNVSAFVHVSLDSTGSFGLLSLGTVAANVVTYILCWSIYRKTSGK